MNNTTNFNLISQKICQIRFQKGYSQEYMARELGINQTSYSKLENDPSKANLDRLDKIAEILEVSLVDLLGISKSNFYMRKNQNANASNHGNVIINNYPVKLLEKIEKSLDQLLKKKCV